MNKTNKNKWDILSKHWDNRMGEEGDWYYVNIVHPVIFKIIGNLESQFILDAGCSTGSLSRMLAKKGLNVIGVDHSLEMIKKAKERQKEQYPNLKYYNFNLKNLSNKLNVKFDIIIANFSLQDLIDYEIVLKEFRNCIIDNGKLVITIEHPFFGMFNELHVTTIRKWIDQKNKIENYVDILKRYKKSKVVEINWDENARTISYYRPLEEYVSALSKANFYISRIYEPTISKKIAKYGPKNNLASVIPMFMIFEAYPLNFRC